jgi:hypothetical protein
MLLLRISLGLAILAGLGVIGVSQFVLKPHVEGIIKVRDDNANGWNNSKAEVVKLKKNLADTTGDLKTTKTKLESTQSELTDASAKLTASQSQAKDLQQNLDKTKSSLKAASDDLAAWLALGIPVTAVKTMGDTIRDQGKEILVLKDDKQLLQTRVKSLTNQLASILGVNQLDPPIPTHVRGKVMVVDPKWNFIVLDVGEKQEVVQNGVLLVSRDGALIAKVRVMSVQKDRSIANIMPGWKLKDVMEGDAVLPY